MQLTDGKQAQSSMRVVCTILKTTFITFKSPLWVDHLLRYVIQVIPRRKYRGQRCFRDWKHCKQQSFLFLVCNYVEIGHKCLTSLQKQRDHCTEPRQYCPLPICCLQMPFLVSGTAHHLHTHTHTHTHTQKEEEVKGLK